MEETITLYKNDTVRSIEQTIESIKKWQALGGHSNPRETALVLTKLEEARMWAMYMVNRDKEELLELTGE